MMIYPNFSIIVIPLYAPTSNAEEAEWFYEELQDLLQLIPPKDVLFLIGDWSSKVGSQETLGSEVKSAVKSALSCVQLFETPWTVA